MLSWFQHLDRVLRGEATRPAQLSQGTIAIPVFGLTTVLVLLGFIYGLCMGCFGLMRIYELPETDIIRVPLGTYNLLIPWQLVATTVKVPALFLLTLLITFPSLYVFNALVGSRLMVHAVWRLLIASLGVNLAVLASLGPVVAFFSVSTTSYPFMVLLNVLIFFVAGLFGLKFLLQTLNRLTMITAYEPPVEPDIFDVPVETVPADSADSAESAESASDASPTPTPVTERPRKLGALDQVEGYYLGRHVMTIFRVWVVVFGLVGAQMGWVLRPFVGDPSMPFTWFRARESNFFQAVMDSLRYLLFGDL